MISFDAETVTGGTTCSGCSGGDDGSGGATGSKTDGMPEEGFSTELVTVGSLGCKFFIFNFNSRLASFCARAVAFWRCFIWFAT